MKSTKFFLSIALAALTIISFGMNGESDNLDFENELVLESWMVSPFELIEGGLLVESWMTTPFQPEVNDVMVESWMTLPFDLGVELEALTLESWMITPFGQTHDNSCGVLMAATCN